MQENWKDIVGYEGRYEVSDLGNIRNARTHYVRSTFIAGRGYPHITLINNGIRKVHKVHRLVAITWIPNPENKPIVNHLDENKLNCRANNLEWCTPKENLRYSRKLYLDRKYDGCPSVDQASDISSTFNETIDNLASFLLNNQQSHPNYL